MKSLALLLAFGLALNFPVALGQEAAKAPALAPRPGEVQLKLPDGGIYIGTVTNGVPDGKGFFKFANGAMYEGDVRMGHRTGVGECLYATGDRYQGEWKDGRPHGTGKMVYMLGGSYEGEWKEGKRDGKGVMVFAGSGRTAEVRFVDGRRVGQAPAQPAASAAPVRYSLYSDHPAPGSHLPDKIVRGAKVPLDRSFAELTPEQREFVRSYYPALDEGDDPPYPVKGGKELFELISKVTWRLGLDKQEITLYVSVDAEGKVTSVSIVGTPDAEAKRTIGTAAALLKYTPGRCSGQPCPGVVPFRLKMVLE